MLLGLALVLLATTLYFTTLTYALRDHSRARLLERLPPAAAERFGRWIERHEQVMPALTAMIRAGANLAILLVAYAWYVGIPEQQDLRNLLAAALIALALLSIFSIAIPQAIATHAAEDFLAANRWPLMALRWLLLPFAAVVQGVDFVVRRLLGKPGNEDDRQEQRVEEDILAAVSEGQLRGAVDEQQGEMIHSVMQLRDTTVNAIMTPRTAIVGLPLDAPLPQVTQILRESAHSRVPVFENSLDQVVGVLYAKDLIGLGPDAPLDLRKLTRPVPFVPGTKTIDELLREFRQSKVHIAIVLDEYGGTAGLVTIEDILEEVVGEIDDEHDETAPPPFRRIDERTIECDARVHVAEINAEVDLEIAENGLYETIGGFVITQLGRIPQAGEELQHEHVLIRVLDAEPRKINRLRLTLTRENAVAAPDSQSP